MDSKNITYEIFHKDVGNPHRNFCATQIDSVLSTSFDRLNSPTVYLESFEQAEEFLTEHPDLTFKKIPAYTPGGPSWPTGSGVIGVWASNYLAYKKFLESDKEVLFLFEDDALVSNNFPLVVRGYLDNVPTDWDFCTFFVPDDCIQWYYYPRENQPWVKPDITGPKDYDFGNPYICRNYQDWSCAGYAVSRKGAQQALADIKKNSVGNPIDWFVFNMRQMDSSNQYFETYSIKPNAFKPVRLSALASSVSVIHSQTEQSSGS